MPAAAGGVCKQVLLASLLVALAGIMLARISSGSLRSPPAAAAAAAASSLRSAAAVAPAAAAAAARNSTTTRSNNTSAVAAKASAAANNMSLRYRSPIVIPPRNGQPHTATVIVLHGLGDTGDGWAGAAPELGAALPYARFVFPHAPERAITLNYGMKMPGWYDIKSLEDIDQREDKEGVLESKRYVLEELVAGGGSSRSDRTAIVGFSQGGAIALSCLRGGAKLAGVVGMSTYVPLRKEPPIVGEANAQTPILLCHGDADQVVAYSFGLAAAELLKEATSAPVELRTYRGMGHSACPEELRDVAAFLKKVLPPV
jgi:lysophospholipase-2